MKTKEILLTLGVILIASAVFHSCRKEQSQIPVKEEGAMMLKLQGDSHLSWGSVCAGSPVQFTIGGWTGPENVIVQKENLPFGSGEWVQIFKLNDGTAPATFDSTFTAAGYRHIRYKIGSGGFTTLTFMVNALPTAVISGDANIDPGSSSNLTIELTGTPPWGITYSVGSTQILVAGIKVNYYILPVSPDVTSTYTLVTVTDANSCSGPVAGSATIIVDGGDCSESFESSEYGNTYTFTYVPDETMPGAFIEFTFPQGVIISAPDGWTQPGQGHVRQIYHDLNACTPFIFTFGLVHSDNGQGPLWTDFVVNGTKRN